MRHGLGICTVLLAGGEESPASTNNWIARRTGMQAWLSDKGAHKFREDIDRPGHGGNRNFAAVTFCLRYRHCMEDMKLGVLQVYDRRAKL